jgi:hypothetical protein
MPIMILPPSHSPIDSDHAMEAALGEPQRGGIPVEQFSKLSFDDFPLRTTVLCVRGIEDKYYTFDSD